ncbi:hypothetical protein WJX84_001631 [Apatococcus fuscideae]|uniref:Uncharacterized protein n=1 Tax=Apatococcus fuscideae TaxID=2026836 RepID=A0AAW1TBN2_9CHLO
MGKGASLTETEGDWISIASGHKPSRPAVKVPWRAGNKVTEDAYLTMQQDWLILKQSEKEKDDKLRRMTAQLARTEEAAKRAMVQQDSSLRGPGAQRLLDAQRQLEELQRVQGEAAARLAVERKRSSDLRAKVDELKQRLHAALREQRRLVQQMGRAGTPGPAARLGPEAHERDMAAAARQIATQQDTIVTLKAQLADQKAANADLSRRMLPRLQQANSSDSRAGHSVSS